MHPNIEKVFCKLNKEGKKKKKKIQRMNQNYKKKQYFLKIASINPFGKRLAKQISNKQFCFDKKKKKTVHIKFSIFHLFFTLKPTLPVSSKTYWPLSQPLRNWLISSCIPKQFESQCFAHQSSKYIDFATPLQQIPCPRH